MVGIMVSHWVGVGAKRALPAPSTKPTVFGAVPCATVEVGVSLPVVKIGTILSNRRILLVSIGCNTPAGKTFLQIQYSMSAMS